MRKFTDYLLISLKGIAMGAADAVPGVSGGTIAFISGIYEELIGTISNVNASLFKTLFKKGFKPFWTQLNGNFILALLTGIIISFVSFMRLAKYLIENHPVLIWAFFFGLIVASIYFVGKEITKWRIATIIALIIGALFAYYITTIPSLANNDSDMYLFFSGALAICAMILPGISGAFILLLLGAYKSLSDAIHSLNIKTLIFFASGAIIGLLSFSKLLKWLLQKHHNTTLAILTGFILGSLNKVWPWKKTLLVYDKTANLQMPFSEVSDLATLSVYQQQTQNFDNYKVIQETSMSPLHYAEANHYLVSDHLVLALVLMVTGFLTIFILERVGNSLNKS